MIRILALLLIGSCVPDIGPPEGYSRRFECTYHGFTVLKGWITVHEDLEEHADRLDLHSDLECRSQDYDAVRCFISESP